MKHKIFSKQTCGWSFVFATSTVAYITIVATIMNHAENIFGKMNNILGPITFLLLFVVSATITGALILGRPVLMYIDGKKKDAVILFFSTLGWLIAFLFLALIVNIVV